MKDSINRLYVGLAVVFSLTTLTAGTSMAQGKMQKSDVVRSKSLDFNAQQEVKAAKNKPELKEPSTIQKDDWYFPTD